MSLSMQKMNLFSENLSNSQTTGYKKRTYAIHSFEDMLVELPDETGTRRYKEKLPVATGSYITQAALKHQQGRLQSTGNQLDVSVLGERLYFQLEIKPPDPKLDPTPMTKRYTISRSGNFQIDVNNYLVNAEGDFVLDDKNQKIRLTADPALANQPPVPGKVAASLDPRFIRIDRFGHIFDEANKVMGPDGKMVPRERAKIKLVEWTHNAEIQEVDETGHHPPGSHNVHASDTHQLLAKYGISVPDDDQPLVHESLRDIHGQAIDPEAGIKPGLTDGQLEHLGAQVKQGYLETSNVDITTEMVSMMMTSKDYDMSQKLIAAEDKILDKTINEMGRLQ